MKIISLAAAAALALAIPASAQDYGRGDDPAMRAPPSDSGYGDGGRGGAPRSAGPRDLHAALHLRPDQDAAWQALNAQTAPDPQRAAEARGDAARIARMSTPQRLDFTQKEMARDADDFARRAVAIRGFYAQLTPDQKSVFDHLTGPQADDRGYPPPR